MHSRGREKQDWREPEYGWHRIDEDADFCDIYAYFGAEASMLSHSD